VLDRPLVLFVVTLAVLAAAVAVGVLVGRRRAALPAAERADLGLVLGAVLTLLGLIIGFSFSMALDRYDQRVALEEAEANAIGTAYLRADVVPAADSARLKALLRRYTELRLQFYRAGAEDPDLAARTAQLQTELWNAAAAAGVAMPNPVTATLVTGINDVLNAQGSAQAAWWNRIPAAAWILMLLIALCAAFLVGYNAKDARRERGVLLVLPFVLSIAFLLIADIESPRGGAIRVAPVNLQSLADAVAPTR
jgi:CDP-diglyceride synthetase